MLVDNRIIKFSSSSSSVHKEDYRSHPPFFIVWAYVWPVEHILTANEIVHAVSFRIICSSFDMMNLKRGRKSLNNWAWNCKPRSVVTMDGTPNRRTHVSMNWRAKILVSMFAYGVVSTPCIRLKREVIKQSMGPWSNISKISKSNWSTSMCIFTYWNWFLWTHNYQQNQILCSYSSVRQFSCQLCKSMDTESVFNALLVVFTLRNTPMIIYSDNGICFISTNKAFKKMYGYLEKISNKEYF